MKALFCKGARKEEIFTRPPVVPIRVRNGTRHCLAYRDKTGTWIDFESGESISGRVTIVR